MKFRQENIMVRGIPFFIPGMTVLIKEGIDLNPVDHVVINHSIIASLFSHDLGEDFLIANYFKNYDGERRLLIVEKSVIGSPEIVKKHARVVKAKDLVYVEADFVELERIAFTEPQVIIEDKIKELNRNVFRLGTFDYNSMHGDETYLQKLCSNRLIIEERQIIDVERASYFLTLVQKS